MTGLDLAIRRAMRELVTSAPPSRPPEGLSISVGGPEHDRRFGLRPATVMATAVAAIGLIGGTLLLTDRPATNDSPLDLPPEQEVTLVAVPPEPSTGLYDWLRAYAIDGVAPVSVGRLNARGLAELPVDEQQHAAQWVCDGTNNNVGCGPTDQAEPNLTGITHGAADVVAWTWVDVPSEATVVVFTDHDGSKRWQIPSDRFAMFRDTLADPDGACGCRMDAYDASGSRIATALLP